MKWATATVECAICGNCWLAEYEKCGFDPSFECPECGSKSGQLVPDTTKEDNELRCCFCGRKIKKEGVCPKCNLTRGV